MPQVKELHTNTLLQGTQGLQEDFIFHELFLSVSDCLTTVRGRGALYGETLALICLEIRLIHFYAKYF